MSHIKFPNIKAIQATFDIDIEFVGDGDSNIYYYKLQHFYPFVIGNSNNKDIFLYPDNVKINFTISSSIIPTAIPPGPTTGKPTLDDYQSEYYSLVRKLSFVETKVVINRNGIYYWSGFIDPQNKVTDYDDLSFEVTILGNIHKLKDIDPREFPADFANQVLYVDLIRDIMRMVIPEFGSVFFTSDIKCQTEFIYQGQPWLAPAQYFGDYLFRFMGPHVPYTNMLEVLKAVSNSWGCVGTIKGKDYYLIPRYYNNEPGVQVITNSDFIHNNGPSVGYSQKLIGMITTVKIYPYTNVHEDILGVVERDVDGNLKNPEEVETLEVINPGGVPPGTPTPTAQISIFVPNSIAGQGNNHWTFAPLNSFFCDADNTRKALWRVVRDSIWPLVNRNRFVYNSKLDTVNWDYHKFYRFKNNESVNLRARKISYDEFGDESEINFIEC